jgi:hypothetical protein
MARCDNHGAPLIYPDRAAAVFAVLLGRKILSEDIGLTFWFALLINRKPRVR